MEMSARERARRREHIRSMFILAFILVVTGILYSIAIQPLPSNLDDLVVSRGALENLHREASHDGR